jgi:hypothetical protein
MKLYQSPLFIISLLLLIYAVYMYFASLMQPGSWGGLIAVIAFVYGGIGLAIHLAIRFIFRPKLKIWLLLEAVVILAAIVFLRFG